MFLSPLKKEGLMYLGSLLLCLSWSHGLYADDFFEERIRPVLIERCYTCHSEEANSLKGELLLDSREGLLKGGESGIAALVPGKPEESPLLEAIRYTNPDFQMPPKEALAESTVADFEQWILSGAVFPESEAPIDLMATARKHWAFHPPKEYPLPAVKDTAWPRSDIDYFVLAKLEANGLVPSKEADRRTLIRRLSFDLLGLPPTPEEVKAFVESTDPEAYTKLLDRYLASPHYGERWGRHWLDVARYADTKGYVYGREELNFTHSYVYRDWVVSALNKDMPYDTFVKLQLAADTLTDESSREDLAAMGFLTLGQRFLGVIPDIMDDRIDTVSRGLMGLTVSCARCHDHKFDPVPTEDYYSLYGVFSASDQQRVLLTPDALKEERFSEFTAGLQEREATLEKAFDEVSAELELRLRGQVDRYLLAVPTAASLPTDEFYEILNADDINPTVVRLWDAYIEKQGAEDSIFGLWNRLKIINSEQFVQEATALLTSADATENAVIVKALIDAKPQTFEEVAGVYATVFKEVNENWLVASTVPSEKGEDLAATSLSNPEREAIRSVMFTEGSPIRVPEGSFNELAWMFAEPARVKISNLNAAIERWIVNSKEAPPYAEILADKSTMKFARVFHRGNPANPGAEVPRQFLELLSGDAREPFSEGSGRGQMAEAIASADNPLTARVLVNRVWGWHFGVGLLATPSDFGTRSPPPSHPELLDWLARYFVKEGWSIKQLHRQLLLSATYRQRSAPMPDEARIQLSTELDPENRLLWHFNRSRLDFESLRDALLFVSDEIDLTVGGKPVNLVADPYPVQRTLYGKVDRRFLPTVFRVFDFPNPDMHSPQRGNTTVPQQALFLMNNSFVQAQSRALSDRATEAVETPDAGRVDWMYQNIYQRVATPEQIERALNFIEEAEASTPPPPPEPEPTQWSYGYGRYDTATERIGTFTPLPHFSNAAYQGGSKWPDASLGWAQLTAEGGHPGNDLDHAVIRRWIAPVTGKLDISGRIQHEPTVGDGILARVVSSRLGTLGAWHVHGAETDANFYGIAVEGGDTIDFIVEIKSGLNSNQFLWVPEIHLASEEEDAPVWNAQLAFAAPVEFLPIPLRPWDKFAQVLLSSNEFLYVD